MCGRPRRAAGEKEMAKEQKSTDHVSGVAEQAMEQARMQRIFILNM
jgi:hypothetical protein